MLEKLKSIRDLSDYEMLVVLHYYSELTTPDRIIVMKNIDNILSTLQSNMHLSPIYIHPDQHAVLQNKMKNNPDIRKFIVKDFTSLLGKGFTQVPEYNYITTKRIFWANNIKPPYEFNDILDNNRVNYETTDFSDILLIMGKIAQMITDDVGSHYGYLSPEYTTSIELLIKYLLKYKVLAKIKLTKVAMRHKTHSFMNVDSSGFEYFHPQMKLLLYFINTKNNDILPNLITSLSQSEYMSNSIESMLLKYNSIKNSSLVREIPLINLDDYNDDIVSKKADVNILGNIDEKLYNPYLDDIINCESVDFNLPDNVKAAIMYEMKDLKYSIVNTGDSERFLIQEEGSNDVFLLYMENSTIRGSEVGGLAKSDSEVLHIELTNLNLDDKYDVVMNEN